MRRLKLRVPWIFEQPSRARRPETRPIGRTGDARYVPQIARFGPGQHGRVVCIANRFDSVSIKDYDRVRFYPVIRDGLRMIRLACRRTNFHFASSRQDMADLAQLCLGPKIPGLIATLMRGSLEFGYQVVAKRWKPDFEVTVTTGQQAAGSDIERYFPFVWTIDRFASFSPHDTMLLVDSLTGDFGGVKQFIYDRNRPHILARDCVHFVNDQEFDGNYGVPLTKAAVPFVEAAESVLDDMSLYSNVFGSPWKKGKYPTGRISTGTDDAGEPTWEENADIMHALLEGIEGSHNIALPSDVYADSQVPRWDLEIMQPPAEDRYVPKLEFLNNMIRMAIAFPQMASAQAPDTGTYNLGQVQIDLFLANIQGYLDQLAEVINEQLIEQFRIYNFGPASPDITLVMEPVDFSAKKALLESLVSYLGTGQPLQDAGGKYIYPNWAKLAEDLGVPVVTLDPREAAQNLLAAARERLAQMNGGNRIDVKPEENKPADGTDPATT